jgi:FkbM family methyltransferase
MDIKQISPHHKNKLKRWHTMADVLFNKNRFFGSRKLYRNMSKLFLPQLENKIFSPTIYGFDLVVGPENAYDYYYLGFYESGALNIFKNILNNGDTFIDVGANIGLMSFYASSLVGEKGKVIAFEPTKKFFDDLSAGINQNGFKNILPLKLGLGSAKGSFPIYFNAVCPSLIKTGDNDPHEIIEIETLDFVIEKNNISNVKLIKIDVEGFELEVVKGGQKLFSSKDAPVICIEYVKDQQKILENGQSALDFLKQTNSYKFFQLEKSSDTICKLIVAKDFEHLHDNDNVFCFLENQMENLKNKGLL